MRVCSTVLASLLGGAALAQTPGAMPPRERDCARWVEPSWTARPATEPASAASGVLSVFADRTPNPDPTLAVSRRPTSLELLLCEQLNVKDKLDYLIRRLGR